MTPPGSHPRRILAFPFHDWRKLQVEGFRTRDAHLLEAFARRPDVERLLVVDRPTSFAERVARRGPDRAAGSLEREWQSGGVRASLTEVSPGTWSSTSQSATSWRRSVAAEDGGSTCSLAPK